MFEGWSRKDEGEGMKKDRKQLGKHDWSGECDPGGGKYCPYDTFSVGIFRWRRGMTKALVRGKVILRIKGDTYNPQAVYDAAEKWCYAMDKGMMPAFKTLNMGWTK